MNDLTTRDPLVELYNTLQGRHMPYDVAQMISNTFNHYGVEVPGGKLPQRSGSYSYSLMPTSFKQPTSLVKITTRLAELTGARPIDEESARDVQFLHRVLDFALDYIRADHYHLDYKVDRLNRDSRSSRGGAVALMSRRQYNRLFRLVRRLDSEIRSLERQHIICELARFAKTGYASKIPFEMFSKDIRTAAFVAYYTANLGRRSIFTSGKQARAYDIIADELFQFASGYDNVCWDSIAMVMPKLEVLKKLNKNFLMDLMSRSFYTMYMSSMIMQEIMVESDINVYTMVVKSGNDSSTWNALAGAWNRARDYWIATCVAAGLEETFDNFMPGKAMRLMAGDVAYWHSAIGGELDPDTKVWSELPKPWQVMHMARTVCNRAMIEQTCTIHGIDPRSTGWSYPRSGNNVAPWEPTLDLVHGIQISNPGFAKWLRKIGAFSGKMRNWSEY